MKDVAQIIIKGSSGYGPVDEAYNDKVTIEQDSIRYEYKPVVESKTNIYRKWSYKTTSPIFLKYFRKAAESVEAILNWTEDSFCTDLGVTSFAVTYADKMRSERDFILPGDAFKECFAVIKQMVPACEYVPAVLLTSEDYEETDE